MPPPSARANVTSPPACCTVRATIDRPSPEPGSARALGERQKRSKTWGSSSAGMPGPWSRTVRTPSARRTSIVPPRGLNFTALSRTLTTARSSAEGSARTNQGCTSAMIDSSGPRSRARRSADSTVSCQATIWVRPECWPVSGRDSSWRSPMSAASSVICAFTDARSALRSASGMGRPVSSLRVRSSMLVRSEVSGVRSSWPASAMSCCWSSRELARAEVIELKEWESRATSSSLSSSTGMRTPRSSVRATCSTASVSLSMGRRPARATASPAAPAPRTPTPETSSRIRARSLSVALVFFSGTARISAALGASGCSEARRRVITRRALPCSSAPSRTMPRPTGEFSITSLSASVTLTRPTELECTQISPSALTTSK